MTRLALRCRRRPAGLGLCPLAQVVYNSGVMAEPGEALTDREREIVSLVATGATNRMIAMELAISPNTVKVHLRNIFTKLEISSRTEATVVAIREGWVEVTEDQAREPERSAATDELPLGEVTPALLEAYLFPHRPLPWRKRLYLVVIGLVVIVATLLTWPRVVSSVDDGCNGEFTAGCSSGNGELAVSEPESLWVTGASLPFPLGRFAMVSLAGELYVIGGETSEGITASVFIYDPREDTWRTASEKLVPSANLAAVALDGKIYAFGGTGSQGEPLSQLEVYDMATDSWSEAASLPVPLAAHTAAAWGEEVFTFGGANGTGYTGDSFVYNPEMGKWARLPSLPTPRGFAGAAVLQDRILVIGGYDGQREYAVCEVFDPLQAAWGDCPSLSTPRGGIGATAVAGQVYVIGGGWESFVTFSERYNPSSNTWRNVETPLLLTAGEWRNLGVAAIGTRVYALGGWQGGRYLGVNLAYETLPNRLYLPAATNP